MLTKATPYNKKHERNPHVDFKTLDKRGLTVLARQWEKEARIFESRLQSYMNNPHSHPEKVARLWESGNRVWKRVRILERWRINNKL